LERRVDIVDSYPLSSVDVDKLNDAWPAVEARRIPKFILRSSGAIVKLLDESRRAKGAEYGRYTHIILRLILSALLKVSR
jgi:hypothetical protein